MTFDEILTQVLDLLRREGRVSYRALKRRFDLDEEYLEDLKAEIIQAKKLAVDEDGAVLVWAGDTAIAPASVSDQERAPLLRRVMARSWPWSEKRAWGSRAWSTSSSIPTTRQGG
jgi:hypothetical protein